MGNHCTVSTPPLSKDLIPDSLSKADIPQDHSTLSLTELSCKPPKLLVLSAGSEYSLAKLTASYADYFKNGVAEETYSEAFMDDLAYTLGSRRTQLPWRSFFTASSSTDLQAVEQNSSAPRQKSEIPPRLSFVFTGQGAQWYGMGQELMVYPIFQKSIHESDTYLRSIGCTWSVFGKPPASIYKYLFLIIARLLYAELIFKP